MLINRRTFIVKRGSLDETLALLKASKQRDGVDYRLYVSNIGPFDRIAMEFEFENLEAYEKGWAEWESTPEAAVFMEKWNELTETGGANEIWKLVDW